MTTAARPTFEPARGGRGKGEGDLSALSKQYSSRDLPAHTRLKYRESGQATQEEVRGRDLRRDLEDRERAAKEKRSGREAKDVVKRPRLDQIPAANLDADDPIDAGDADDLDDDDDSEDDTAELMAELNRIKRERAAEQAKREVEKRAEEERIRTETFLSGNPLLNQQKGDFKVKRRWDDDVVFKNCAKGLSEQPEGKFINDTLRSEFHKKFMDKYIK